MEMGNNVGCQDGQPRRRSRRGLVRELLLDYSQKSSLHGPRYFTEPGLHVVERVFWMATFACSVALCGVLIVAAWRKWQASPVIVNFSERLVPVSAVPFPSLTICPAIKSKPSIYNYSGEYERLFQFYNDPGKMRFRRPTLPNDTVRAADRKLRDVSLVCRLSAHWNMFEATARQARLADLSTVHNILQVSPRISDYMKKCTWGGSSACEGKFSTVLTEEGVCFTFNGIAAKDIFRLENIQRDYNYSDAATEPRGWSASEGYAVRRSPTSATPVAYPYRGLNLRHDPNLRIHFKVPKSDYDSFCNAVARGFKVYLHQPGTHPQSSQYALAALPARVTALALDFTKVSTSASLRSYSPDIRQCYFEGERPLRYFRWYSAANCLLECMALFVYSRCRCVPFHMPHEDSRSICTIAVQSCVRKARVNFTRAEESSKRCACYPACDEVRYNAELQRADFDSQAYADYTGRLDRRRLKASKYHNHDNMEFALLEVYFRQNRYLAITRSQLFGPVDFLASCGGLLGLFLGFSFLSIVEIIYFLTLRLGYIIKKDSEEEKATQQVDIGNHTELEPNKMH